MLIEFEQTVIEFEGYVSSIHLSHQVARDHDETSKQEKKSPDGKHSLKTRSSYVKNAISNL